MSDDIKKCTNCGVMQAFSESGAIFCENCGKAFGDWPAIDGLDASSHLPDTNPELAHLIDPDGAIRLLTPQPPPVAVDELRAALAAAEKRLREADALLKEFEESSIAWGVGAYPPMHKCLRCGRYSSAQGGVIDIRHTAECPVERARQWRKEAGR